MTISTIKTKDDAKRIIVEEVLKGVECKFDYIDNEVCYISQLTDNDTQKLDIVIHKKFGSTGGTQRPFNDVTVDKATDFLWEHRDQYNNSNNK